VEFAARYVPAGDHEVGGDWHDVFGLPSGWMCLVERRSTPASSEYVGRRTPTRPKPCAPQ
jgi:hypothetical protein